MASIPKGTPSASVTEETASVPTQDQIERAEAEGAPAPKTRADEPTAPPQEPPSGSGAKGDRVRIIYRGTSGRLVDEQSGSEFLRDGDPVEVDIAVYERLRAIPHESFSIATEVS